MKSEITREVLIKAADAPKQIVYGEVYAPLVEDSHGDWMTAEQIELMAHKFMKSGRVKALDREHNLKETGAVVVESFIARKGDPDFAEGAWVLGCHVADSELWAAIEKGEVTGFSMYGQGVRTPRAMP